MLNGRIAAVNRHSAVQRDPRGWKMLLGVQGVAVMQRRAHAVAGRQEKAQLFPEHSVRPADDDGGLEGYAQVGIQVSGGYVAHLNYDGPTLLLPQYIVEC